MNENDMKWKTLAVRPLLQTPVYDVISQTEQTSSGLTGDYIAIEAPDWVMVVPVYQGQFVLVQQWRHGEDRLTLEFPGGVADQGEDPAETARRELLEETGFRVGKLTHLGTCSPNPALFKNHFHCYLAEDLEPTGERHLDADELLCCQTLPIDEVISCFGDGRFTHALMGTALAFYLRHGLPHLRAKDTEAH